VKASEPKQASGERAECPRWTPGFFVLENAVVKEGASELQLRTRQEICERFRLSRGTLDYYVATGQIPFVRLGKRSVRFREDRLLEWLEERANVGYHRSGRE